MIQAISNFVLSTKMIAKCFVSIIIHIQKIPFDSYHTSKEFLLFFNGRRANIYEGSFHCCGSVINTDFVESSVSVRSKSL